MPGILALVALVSTDLHDDGRHSDEYLSPGDYAHPGEEQGVVQHGTSDKQDQPQRTARRRQHPQAAQRGIDVSRAELTRQLRESRLLLAL